MNELQLPDEAKKDYETAIDLAGESNEIANKGSELVKEYETVDKLLIRWDEIHSNTPYKVFTAGFIIICVVEFYFSQQIYRDIIKQMPPWLIALGLTIVSVFTSKYLKKSLNQASRDRAYYMEEVKTANKGMAAIRVKDKIDGVIKKQAILGWIFFAAIILITAYLSYIRAGRELRARLRLEPFNMIDLLPVVFYVVEVFSGLFLIYTADRFIKGFRRASLKNTLMKLVKRCSDITDETVKFFSEAKSKGFNPAFHRIGQGLHLAYYRNMHRNESQFLEYFSSPEMKLRRVKFIFKSDKNWTGNATVITEYNFAAKAAFDISKTARKSGEVEFEILGFDNDSVREIILDFPNSGSSIDAVIPGPFEMNSITHEVYIDT